MFCFTNLTFGQWLKNYDFEMNVAPLNNAASETLEIW